MAEDVSDGSFSGLYATLIFPSRVVVTAVYLGYGASLVPPPTSADSYDARGDFKATIRLCAPENEARCPH